MPTGYAMVNVRHTISGVVKEMYLKEAEEYLTHPWFSQFYVLDGMEYDFGLYGIGPYGQ